MQSLWYFGMGERAEARWLLLWQGSVGGRHGPGHFCTGAACLFACASEAASREKAHFDLLDLRHDVAQRSETYSTGVGAAPRLTGQSMHATGAAACEWDRQLRQSYLPGAA